ncbi:MAG: hypothetical protein ABIT05_04595 [Chitinophagaceae bacterium]
MMKITKLFFLILAFAGFLFTGCSNNKEPKTTGTAENTATGTKTGNTVPTGSAADLEAPDFSDPALKQYFALYTNYLKKVIVSIQNKDEAGTMKLFTDEGKQFNNKNEMEEKARAAEEQKFTAWLMQTAPYYRIIVESDYYKKWNEEYYKNVKEKFNKKNL